MKETSNLKLALAEGKDIIDFETHFNPNWEKIDSEITSTNAQLAETVKLVNVKIYENLVTNGDWTTAIQTAINENPNKTVYFPAGTYSISATITVPHKIRLQGESKNTTIIQTDTDINMIDLKDRTEMMNFTFFINLLLHSKSVIRYFAKQGGNKNGLLRDIYIHGLDGYQNTTKAIELMGDPLGTPENRSYVFWYTFENFFIEFCDTAWYTEADFNTFWSTACTFRNFVVERCKRAFYFNTTFMPGYYSKYDLIEWQFQCNDKMQRAYEAPSDRSFVDIQIWDRAFFAGKPKSIYIKGASRNNIFMIRNVDQSDVEIETPVGSVRNTFKFTDDTISKNVILSTPIYIDPVNGSDGTSTTGTSVSPFKTLAFVINYVIPKHISGTVEIILKDGTYPEYVEVRNFYGGGLLKIRGNSHSVNIYGIKSQDNRCKVHFERMTVKPVSGDIGVLLTDSAYTYLYYINIVPASGVFAGTGFYVQGTTSFIREPVMSNCTTAFDINSSSMVRVDTAALSNGITTGFTVRTGSYLGLGFTPSLGNMTTLYNASTGGTINPNKGVVL